jgi:hypothetical protein
MTPKSAYQTLNPRQKTFIEGITAGMSQAQAYRAAGYSDKGATASASRMLAKANVAKALAERKKPHAIAIAWDRDRLTTELLTNLTLARELGQMSAANRAAELLAKHLGLLEQPQAPAALGAGVTLTASLSVAELRHVVGAMRDGVPTLPAIEAGGRAGVVDVVAGDAGDAGAEDAGDSDEDAG